VPRGEPKAAVGQIVQSMAKVRNRFHRQQPCTLKEEFFGGEGGLAVLWLPSQGL